MRLFTSAFFNHLSFFIDNELEEEAGDDYTDYYKDAGLVLWKQAWAVLWLTYLRERERFIITMIGNIL